LKGEEKKEGEWGQPTLISLGMIVETIKYILNIVLNKWCVGEGDQRVVADYIY